MANYDVFNGDADGLCALHQLRLHTPQDNVLITGVKRDIGLLKNVDIDKAETVTVLDISLDKNRKTLDKLMQNNVKVIYFDHHYPGDDLPRHKNVELFINTSSHTCTSLIVNNHIGNIYPAWAITAAFGDNLITSARNAAKDLSYSESKLELLCELGTYLNYNGYGSTLDDLHFAPSDLYQKIKPYADPFDFIENEEAFQVLRNGYIEDMNKVNKIKPVLIDDRVAIYILPEKNWARRVSGVYSNKLSITEPERAHAILSSLPQGGFQVSVRAPQVNKSGADKLCRNFPTGGGRSGAAGINLLDESDLNLFYERFRKQYG